jgi:DNA-binding NarL/FixJ family response regulator
MSDAPGGPDDGVKISIVLLESSLVVSGIAKLRDLLKTKRKEPILTMATTVDISRSIIDGLPCVVVLYMAGDQDLVAGINFLKAIGAKEKKCPARVLIVSKADTKKMSSAFLDRGANEFLSDKSSPSTLFFKTTILLNQVEKLIFGSGNDVVNIRGGKQQKDEKIVARGGNTSNVQTSIETIAEDVWMIKGTPPRRVGVQWVVEAEGPDPDSGDWEFVGSDGVEEWAWKPYDINGRKIPKADDEGWNFTGNKPNFDPDKGKWKFVAAKPDLSHEKDGKKVGSKIQSEGKGITIAADNPASAEKIQASKKVGQVVKARKEKELQEKIAAIREEEAERARKGRSLLNREDQHGGKSAADKALEEEMERKLGALLEEDDGSGVMSAGKSNADSKKENALGKNGKPAKIGPDGKPIAGSSGVEDKDDLQATKGKLSDANGEEGYHGSSKKGKAGELDSKAGGKAKDAKEAAAFAKATKATEDDEGSESFGKKQKEEKENTTQLARSKTDAKTQAEASQNKKSKGLKPGDAGYNPSATGQDDDEEALDPKNPNAKKERFLGRAVQAKARKLDKDGKPVPGSEEDGDEDADSKNSQAADKAKGPNGINAADAIAKNATGAPLTAKEKDEADRKSKLAKDKDGNALASGALETGDGSVGLSDWEAEKRKSKAQMKAGAATQSDITEKNYIFKKTNGKLRSSGANKPLKKMNAKEFNPDDGVWEPVGDKGWVFVVAEMRSQGPGFLMAQSFAYLEKKNGNDQPPFYDGKSKSWLFSEDQQPKNAPTFEDLPEAYQHFLHQLGAKPVDPLVAHEDTAEALRKQAALTAETFAMFTDDDKPVMPGGGTAIGDQVIEKGPSHLSFFLKLSNLVAQKTSKEEIYKYMTGYIRETIDAENVFLLTPHLDAQGNVTTLSKILASTNQTLKVGETMDLAKTRFSYAFTISESGIFPLSEAKSIAIYPLIQHIPKTIHVGALFVQFEVKVKAAVLSNNHFLEQLTKQLTRMLKPAGPTAKAS